MSKKEDLRDQDFINQNEDKAVKHLEKTTNLLNRVNICLGKQITINSSLKKENFYEDF